MLLCGSGALTAATGNYNTAVGQGAGSAVTSANYNTLIGYSAGSTGTNNLTSGSDNVILGSSSNLAGATDTNEIVIGALTTGLGSNTTIIGKSSTTQTHIGGIILPIVIYSHAGTQLAACAAGIVGGMAVVSDATALTPGTAYSVSAGAGSDTVYVQCALIGTTYAWQTM